MSYKSRKLLQQLVIFIEFVMFPNMKAAYQTIKQVPDVLVLQGSKEHANPF